MAPSEPSSGSLKMAVAPKAATMRLRSLLTLPGMTSSTGNPNAAPIIASAMPVFPDVESMIVLPGTSFPCARPISIILRAGRSFTEPPGLKPSSLAKMRTSSRTPSRSVRISTSGVLPINSTMERATNGPASGPAGTAHRTCAAACVMKRRSAPACDGRHDRQLVAGLHRSRELLHKADVLAVHEDVDEAPHLPRLVADAVLDAGVLLVQIAHDRGD